MSFKVALVALYDLYYYYYAAQILKQLSIITQIIYYVLQKSSTGFILVYKYCLAILD